MSVGGASHELSAAERKEIEAKARIPRSCRQVRAYISRLEQEDRPPGREYLLSCLRVVLMEMDVALALEQTPLHPGIKVRGNCWPEADPETRFTLHHKASDELLLRRGYRTKAAATAAAMRLAEAAEWRLPTDEFSAAHHAAVLAEEHRA